jgi:hypothetical protein
VSLNGGRIGARLKLCYGWTSGTFQKGSET